MSDNSARALKDWRSYWQLAVCFLVGAHIARVRVREVAFWTLAVSSGAACLLAFAQRMGGFDVGPIHVGAEHRVGGTLYTTTFAGVLYQLIVLHAATAASSRVRGRRWLVLIVVLEFVAILFTMTRGAWIALFAGLAVATLLLRSRVLAFAVAGALVVLAAFSLFYARDQGRTISVTTMATSEPDRNVGTRLVLWDISWEMFREHPLVGVGMGDYTTEAQARLDGRSVRTAVDSHNVFLHVLATRGLVGFLPLIAYFVVLALSLREVVRRSEPGSLPRHYAAGALGVTAAVLAGALTENNIDDSEVFIAFMFTVGLARSALTQIPSRDE
jgi:O-antigen ligase